MNLKVKHSQTQYLIMFRLVAYCSGILYKFDALAKDEIVFTATEWSLMKLIRKKPTIANTELAQIMGYGVRNIEEICAQIRKKMDFELIEDSKVKRNLLIQFVLS